MRLKRLFDIIAATVGLIVVSPLMLLITIIIKMESRGPVFYRCVRVGRFGKTFHMLKFRTMVENADDIDCKLCSGEDVRVTPFGALLRRTKFNEWPQMFNVVAGHMSLVGPRPEDPKFINHYKEKWDIVLSVRPGVAGVNQLLHRNEEDLFPRGVDRETYYVEHILPEKLDRDIAYVENHTFWSDIRLLMSAFIATVFGGGLISKIINQRELLAQLLADLAFSVIAFLIAHIVRLDRVVFDRHTLPTIGMITAINLVLFPALGLYARSARFFSVPDLLSLVKASFLSVVILTVGNVFLFSWQGCSRAVLIFYPLVLVVLLSASRIIHKQTLEKSEIKSQPDASATNVLIYGAGRLGAETLQRLKFEPGVTVLGFVDDDPSLRNRSIDGVKVMGDGYDLPFLTTLHRIDQVFIAFSTDNQDDLNQARERCLEAGLANVIIASTIPVPSNGVAIRKHFRRIRFTDVLGIPEVRMDEEAVREIVGGTSVALVGASDHFGEHICRELFRVNVAKLVVLEDSQERLARITEAIDHINSGGTPCYPYSFPFGFGAAIEEVLKSHGVNWIIYGRPEGPAAAVPLNEPMLFLTEFLQIVRFVELSKQIGSQGFFFLSPYLKDGFSARERTFHLLSENYVSLAAQTQRKGTRLATMRMANILENEVGILKKHFLRRVRGIPTYVPRGPMRFSSARYVARNVLNALTLGEGGETFVESSGASFSLGSLMDFYSEFEEKGGRVLSWPTDSKVIHTIGTDLEHSKRLVETRFPDVLMLRQTEFTNCEEIERLVAMSGRYLTPDDRMLLKSFFSALYEASNLNASAPREMTWSDERVNTDHRKAEHVSM